MYGYVTQSGYMGYVAGQWMLFATDRDYYEYVNEEDNI